MAGMTVDERVARRLIAAQFPEWADLPLAPVKSSGTDNAIFRLGREMAVRLPRVEWAAGQAEREHRWLPELAARLPLPVPVPLALGRPGGEYPWHWSVCRWIEGENAIDARLDDPYEAAVALGRFVSALHRIDPAGGPKSGRGVPLAARDDAVRRAIAELRGVIDTGAAAAAWEAALQAPAWQGPDVWIHGDLHAGNLLVAQGRLAAVLDFGLMGVGDPACDWLFAWNLLDSGAREKLRAELSADEAEWARGRGWALSVGLIALPYYRHSNPVFAGVARRLIDEALADHRRGG